ncbi:hypothetical protein ABH905_005044 [Pseudomonas frederiksbergensis]|uniref:AidA/PixA family protein n=1 Tax=Pseudomonas frederiksbergensis TaxID=104087 RepID=UPI003D2256E4
MSNDIVDILVAIDTDTLLNMEGKEFKGGMVFSLANSTSADPIQIGSYYGINDGKGLDTKVIYMIAPYSNVIASEGIAELNIQVKVGDVIRWRSTALSKGLDHAVLLYRYTKSSGQGIIGHGDKLGPDVSPVYTSPLPIINFDNPGSTPTKQNVENFYWQGEAQMQGQLTYSWDFMIVDSSNKVLGYCTWDPYITINP